MCTDPLLLRCVLVWMQEGSKYGKIKYSYKEADRQYRDFVARGHPWRNYMLTDQDAPEVDRHACWDTTACLPAHPLACLLVPV